jgi:6-phosphogluconate dehydrogenase
MSKADIGLIGLAVMGQNLVLNMDDHGYTVAVFNRTPSKVDDFLQREAKGTKVIGAHSIEELVGLLKKPRRVMMMVKAGKPVDDLIDSLIPFLEKGDIIIDGGNSNYLDSIRRTAFLESKGFLFLGVGISGGEDGARFGPSIMPGGSRPAWEPVRPIFQSIAAKVARADGWEDPGLGFAPEAMRDVFAGWNEGKLNSYLIEITRDILAFQDEDGQPLVDKILDKAGQKGTGRWAGISALELGIPLTMITEAVSARSLSTLKDERTTASRRLTGPAPRIPDPVDSFLADLGEAVYASKIISYTQGYMLMRAAAQEYKWDMNYGGIALMWRGGCIIRSLFLQKIKDAYDTDPALRNLLLDSYFKEQIETAQAAWRRVLAAAVGAGIPTPAMSSALSFFDSYRRAWLPANLIQAQRDYFGAHTYERVDQPRGEFFHTDWTGHGGKVTSSTYSA